MMIDTHIHLDNKRYQDDLDEVLSRARGNGVERFIIPGADPKTLGRAIEISEQNDDVYFAVGVHPYDNSSFDDCNFEKFVSHKKCIAIGECGLDYYRLEGDSEEREKDKFRQKEIFIKQIHLAKIYKKPLIVHIRDASSDAKKILIEQNAREVGGVLHCYNADEELLSLSEHGFYFGIGGVLTFKNAKKLVNILSKIDLKYLLVETDGPYLTPEPYRGKRNEPDYIRFVIEKISDILDINLLQITKITTTNAKKLFKII